MKTQSLYTIEDVAQAAGVPHHRILYHHRIGSLPEPARLGNRRVYTLLELNQTKTFFASREKWQRISETGPMTLRTSK